MEREIQIHRLATDDRTSIHKNGAVSILIYNPAPKHSGELAKNLGIKYYNLYGTVSQDIEPIKSGDWHLEIDSDGDILLNQANDNTLKAWNHDIETTKNFLRTCRKIVLTTDTNLIIRIGKDIAESKDGFNLTYPIYGPITQFETSFIKEFCEQGGIDNALVDYDVDTEPGTSHTDTKYDEYNLKVNDDNTSTVRTPIITHDIPKKYRQGFAYLPPTEEGKKYTKQEFIDFLMNHWKGIHGEGTCNTSIINAIKKDL